MRSLLLTTIVTLSIACSDHHRKEAPQLAGDTISNTQSTTDTAWVLELYKGSADTIGYQSTVSIEYFHQLNDSVSYCLFSVSSPTCLETYLATQVRRRHIQMQQVGEGCDSDLSHPRYSYSEYDHDSTLHVIITRSYDEKAKPEFIENESGFDRFKEGYTMDNAGTITDSSMTVWKVAASGVIVSRKTPE
jgi:hypothetical protein